jgi:VanZ family protein
VKTRVAITLAVLSTLAILFLTLRQGGTSLTSSWSFNLTSGDAALAELIQNLILFIPLGVSLTLAGVRPSRVIASGALLSFSVEFAQQWIPGRDPSVGDIVCNTTSTALGALLVVTAPIWLWAPPRRSAWQALGTASVAFLVWYGTGAMLRQTFPPLPYHIVTTPDFDHFGQYKGKVISVTPPGKSSLEVAAVAAPYPPGRTSPLIAVLDRHDAKVLMLSVDETDLTLRYAMPALRATLEQPDLRLRHALQSVAPGDTFMAATRHDSTNICLGLNATYRCNLGYTIGDGWKLIYYPEGRPAWMLDLINTLWIAGCVIGVGFWAARNSGGEKGGGEGRRRGGGLAVGIVIAGILLVPLVTGLKPTPINEWVGALGGMLGGWWVGSRGWDDPPHRSRQL